MPFGLHLGGTRGGKNYSRLPTSRYFKATRDPIIRESDLPHKTGISRNTISLSDSYSKPQTAGGATIYMSERRFEIVELK